MDTESIDIFIMSNIYAAVMGERIAAGMHKDAGARLIIQRLCATQFEGWEVWHTGGGCTAYGRNIVGNRHILITSWEGCSHEIEPGDDVMIGVYKDDDVTGEPCEGWFSFTYKPTSLTEKDINDLVEAFLNAGCAEVQKRLGIKDGMTASLFWDGNDNNRRIIRDYITTEINFR